MEDEEKIETWYEQEKEKLSAAFGDAIKKDKSKSAKEEERFNKRFKELHKQYEDRMSRFIKKYHDKEMKAKRRAKRKESMKSKRKSFFEKVKAFFIRD